MNIKHGPMGRLKACLVAGALCAVVAGPAEAQRGGETPPPVVGVIKLQGRAVPVMSELPGRVAATRISEVRARVSGILQERVFEQGSLVTQNEVLYRIDPRLFKVRVASAEASVQRAKATQANAVQQLRRQKTLKERNVASGIDLDAAMVAVAQAEADVAVAAAVLEEARIHLEYTEVRAPITGIIGGALMTEGALVTADGSSNLALIQQVDPIYADFTQSAQALLSLKRAVTNGKLVSPAAGQPRVELAFGGGDVYPMPGKLLFSSASVDSTTGQLTLRAEFPNPNGDLLPGMYVRIRIEQAVREPAITVPQRSFVRTKDGQTQVFVVGKDSTAEAREVILGPVVGSDWIVESGLAAGEQVIVDGVQKVQQGGKVVPEPSKSELNQPAENAKALDQAAK